MYCFIDIPIEIHFAAFDPNKITNSTEMIWKTTMKNQHFPEITKYYNVGPPFTIAKLVFKTPGIL